MSGFNELFNKLQRQAEAKEKRARRRTPGIYTGDTAAGRAIASGKQREDSEEREKQNLADPDRGSGHASWNIREFKSRPAASRSRGKFGGIRK